MPELGGYDYEFTGEVPDDCRCLVCQLPMKDPVQIVQCGHRLCNICMESLFSRPSPLCPADRQPLSRDKVCKQVPNMTSQSKPDVKKFVGFGCYGVTS